MHPESHALLRRSHIAPTQILGLSRSSTLNFQKVRWFQAGAAKLVAGTDENLQLHYRLFGINRQFSGQVAQAIFVCHNSFCAKLETYSIPRVVKVEFDDP